MFAWRSADKGCANFTGRELPGKRSHEMRVRRVIATSATVRKSANILAHLRSLRKKAASADH
jgi:hypothetical protein